MTVAPGTPDPWASVTTPAIVAVVALWAKSAEGCINTSRQARTRDTLRMTELLLLDCGENARQESVDLLVVNPADDHDEVVLR